MMGLLTDFAGIRKTLSQKKDPTTGVALPSDKPSAGMPSLPGQSPLGMSSSASPGSSLSAATGQRSYFG